MTIRLLLLFISYTCIRVWCSSLHTETKQWIKPCACAQWRARPLPHTAAYYKHRSILWCAQLVRKKVEQGSRYRWRLLRRDGLLQLIDLRAAINSKAGSTIES